MHSESGLGFELSSESTPENSVLYEEIEDNIDALEMQGLIPLAMKFQQELDKIDENNNEALIALADRIKSALAKRNEITKKVYVKNVEVAEHGPFTDLEIESINRLPQIIERAKVTKNFLGEGGTAIVHHDEVEPRICYKIYNGKSEKWVNPAIVEAKFLSDLADLNVEGVRTPVPHYTAISGDFKILTMETLNAVSLENVLNGVELPTTYVHQKFFTKLKKYLEQMHDRGIYHRDLFPKNIMVDKVTGDPYVIDFGLSCRAFSGEDPYHQRDDLTEAVIQFTDDLDALKVTEQRIAKYLKRKI